MPDLTSYQKAALQYKKHISLTANAGSGKTFVLSKRFVEIALNEDISLRNIVAITFTDKAAGELNKRIASEVLRQIETKKNIIRKRKLEKIRRQLVSANISTIHSFCIEILREFSPEAGLDANFIPIDQNTADELVDLSIEESVNSLLKDDLYEPEIKQLIRFLGSKRMLASEMKSLLFQRKNIIRLEDSLYSKPADEIAEYFREKFTLLFNDLFSSVINQLISAIKIVNDEVLNFVNEGIPVQVSDLLGELDKSINIFDKLDLLFEIKSLILTKKNTVNKRNYLKKGVEENLTEGIAVIENNFGELKYFHEIDSHRAEKALAENGKLIIRIFKIIYNDYSERKRQKGYVDFEDILLLTQKIIENPDVLAQLRNKYKYVMIDEYQDTNEIQYKIFMPILNYLKSGNLFVVGDEKQSIYMFRDAELKIFKQTKNEISAKDSETSLLKLPHSFRVAKRIAAFVNVLFSRLFENPHDEFNEVGYSELICSRQDDSTGRIEFLIAEDETENDESEMVAAKILQLTSNDGEEKLSYKDCAILCRKRSSFADLEKSLNRLSIPYNIIGGKGYYQRQIIYDVKNYLTFLLNKNDDTALAGILRSPFFSLPDSELFEISLAEGKSFFQKLRKYSAGKSSISKIITMLKNHLSIAQSADVSRLLRTIVSDTGYVSVVASKQNSKQELANLNKLFLIAKKFEQQGLKSLFDFIDYLNESIGSLEDEGQASVANDGDSVKIMTIHQAKGLEFKAVFIYKCNEAARESSVKAKSIIVDKQFGILSKVPINNNYFGDYKTAPIVGLYNFIEHKRNMAEVKRLLYVSITRAIDYLFISAALPKSKINKGSFIQLLIQGLNIDFQEEGFNISSDLKFMIKHENGFKTESSKIQFDIPIVKQIEMPHGNQNISEKPADIKNILLEDIRDIPEGEIISATKISVFNQCPVKYQLTYDIGFSSIKNIFGNLVFTEKPKPAEFQVVEENNNFGIADVKGRIVHKLLEEETDAAELNYKIKEYLEKEFSVLHYEEKIIIPLEEEIKKDMVELLKSKSFSRLKSFDNYFNEFEVYTKYTEYYLFGIIDKIVFDSGRIILIDYKTDNIEEGEITERSEHYLTQLLFYAFIIKKIYQPDSIRVNLLFIKHPDKIFQQEISQSDLQKFEKKLNEILEQIKDSSYSPNLGHCLSCHYSDSQNKCIKSR